MKFALTLAALTLVASATTVQAEDFAVSNTALNQLGLGNMTILSDEAGMQIRGKSGNASACGLSLVTGLLIDPNTKSFIFGADADSAMASAENAGLQVLTIAESAQVSNIELNLNVVSANGAFTAFLSGGAGGSAAAGSQ